MTTDRPAGDDTGQSSPSDASSPPPAGTPSEPIPADPHSTPVEHDATFDALVEDLRQLRGLAGQPSYAEIALRVGQLRRSSGIAAYASTPSKSTVYDVFRPGRARMNPELVRDIAGALGAEDPQQWYRRCVRILERRELQAMRQEGVSSPGSVSTEALDPTEPSDSAPLPPETPAPVTPAPVAPAPEPPSDLPAERDARNGRRDPAALLRWPGSGLLLLASVLLNLVGLFFTRFTGVPLHLDMVGTGVAAVTLGPLAGIAVAVATHLVNAAVFGIGSLPFTAVSIAGALVWGYGARWLRRRGSENLWPLHLLVALISTAIAVPMILLLLDGIQNRPLVYLQGLMRNVTLPDALTVLILNLSVSVPDKMLSGVMVSAVYSHTSAPPPRPADPGSDSFRGGILPTAAQEPDQLPAHA
ncbi:hypothetical protein JSY14_00250 [Brachybacterium sp. EF45031]|uniref:ECF transporter S component n=1 Tax=Brachybacterium sillae TaxID=2810536 RepID=UPI00217E24C0|nr:ECF transporter S component [Brachybacterium sillae]MCS6710523.1 hypothetical protein [Brachybacterium sillae]